MLEKLHWLAVRLVWLQPLVVVVGGASLIAVGYLAIAQSASTEQYLVPALVLFCWCLLIHTLVSMFREPPPALDQQAGFLRRLAIRFNRFLRGVLALVFLGLSVSVVILSYKLIATGVG